jgi:hypothetical protein
VGQLVPECDDGRDVGNLRGEHWAMLHGDAESLAELLFDRGAEESIVGVVFEAFPSRSPPIKATPDSTNPDELQLAGQPPRSP